MPPLASARIIDLQAARLALGREGEQASPATLGEVPLSFRQWHGDLVQRAPRFRREAWAAAAAIHAIIGGAILLYASLTTLPPPLPGIAVTLSFEPAKPAGEPSAAPTETATPETATPEANEAPTAEATPPAPEPPVEAAPPEPTEVVPPPQPTPPEPTVAEPPPPEPPLAVTPEAPKPVTETPPPPIPTPRPPPRPTAKPAPPVKRTVPSAAASPAAGAPTGATTAGTADSPPATLVAPSPLREQLATIPPTQASPAPGNRKPDYPMTARRGHFEGRLVLRVDVTDAGTASAVAVAVSSGHAILDEAAVTALQGWHFNPATRDGVAVAGVAYVPIQFRLQD